MFLSVFDAARNFRTLINIGHVKLPEWKLFFDELPTGFRRHSSMTITRPLLIPHLKRSDAQIKSQASGCKICDIYYMQLGFHLVAIIRKLEKKNRKETSTHNTRKKIHKNIKPKNTQNIKQSIKIKKLRLQYT
jgi:hypothetical protein